MEGAGKIACAVFSNIKGMLPNDFPISFFPSCRSRCRSVIYKGSLQLITLDFHCSSAPESVDFCCMPQPNELPDMVSAAIPPDKVSC